MLGALGWGGGGAFWDGEEFAASPVVKPCKVNLDSIDVLPCEESEVTTEKCSAGLTLGNLRSLNCVVLYL